MSQSIAELRQEYSLGALTKADVDPDPIRQFQRWLDEAINAQLPEPNALTLATADRTGRPFARVVLLKDCDADGFAFYTNYRSDKGRATRGKSPCYIGFSVVGTGTAGAS